MSVLTIKCSCGSSYEIPCACASETSVTPPNPQEQVLTLANQFREYHYNKIVPYTMDRFIEWVQEQQVKQEGKEDV